MNAIEFVKKFGWGEFKELYQASLYVEPFQPPSEKIIGIKKSEIKELFDAFELVETGLPELKQAMFSDSKDLDYVKNWVLTVSEKLLTEKGIKLKQAINLMEQCQ